MSACRAVGTLAILAMLPSCSPKDARANTAESSAIVRRVHGDLTGEFRQRLAPAVDAPATLLVLDSASISNCEDLGRQLREVQRTRFGKRHPTVVAATQSDAAYVREWLARERIATAAQFPDADSLYAGGARVRAPAVLLLDAQLSVSAGVIHRTRVNNTRTRSFAAELAIQ